MRGFDPSPDARGQLAAAGGAAFEDRGAALDGAEAVVVASPNACHRNDLETALRLGLHVFVEKPLSHTDAGVDALLECARSKGLVVYPAMNQRFHPVVLAARQMLEGGDVGAPLWARFLCASYLPDWRAGQDYRTGYAAHPVTGGVLFDIVHEFDLANFLLGPAKTAAAVARTTGVLGIAAEDCADVILAHASGVTTALHLDYVTRPRRRGFDIGCTGGLLEADLTERTLTVTAAGGELLRDESWANTSVADQYREEMAQFLSCMHGDARPICSATEALQVLRQVLDARALSGLPQQ